MPARGRGLKNELLVENTLLKVMFGIEQQAQADIALLLDRDAGDIAHLDRVGNGADGTLFGFENFKHDARFTRQNGAAPAPRLERADGGEGENYRLYRP